MPLIDVPPELKKISVSIFDGHFFGFLPFPDRACHSLWHVRYAIRANWSDPINDLDRKLTGIIKQSHWPFMLRDCQRYLPLLGEAKYLESLYETKAVLSNSEENDARPILFRKDYGFKNHHLILGGKIDNIYDILTKLTEFT